MKGFDQACPSRKIEERVLQTQTIPGSKGAELGPPQASIQNVNPQTHTNNCQRSRLVFGNRPKG